MQSPSRAVSRLDLNGRSQQRSVQSVEVGGQLLLTLSTQAQPLGLKDLAALCGLSAARAHPYLVAFIKLGLIEQDRVTQRYSLGPGALQMALACLYQIDVVGTSATVAQHLSAATGHSVLVSVWGNFGPTVVRLVDGTQPLHVDVRAGTVISLLRSATGRAFAASLPLHRLEQVVLRPLGDVTTTRTPFTVSMREEVTRCVKEYRTHGFLRSIGRPVPTVSAFSAPAFDHEGDVAVVMTVLGHSEGFASDWTSPIAVAVRAAAMEISTTLGHQSVVAT